jgi:hypothetical protein
MEMHERASRRRRDEMESRNHVFDIDDRFGISSALVGEVRRTALDGGRQRLRKFFETRHTGIRPCTS